LNLLNEDIEKSQEDFMDLHLIAYMVKVINLA